MTSYYPTGASSLRRDASLLEKTKKSAANLRWDKMARKSFLAVTVIIFFLLSFLSTAQGLDWKEAKDTHFIIYHTKQDSKFAKEILSKSESYYKSIPRRLGMSQSFSFWTWDNRVKIYIYPDRVTFLEQTGTQGWSRAIANYRTRVVSFYKGRDATAFLNTALPHELTHLLFREFIGVDAILPLWLDEGVAQLMEKGKLDEVSSYIGRVLDTDYFINLDTLIRLDIRRVKDKELVTIFYMEACLLANFLIEHYGSSKFKGLCNKIRDGETFTEAFAAFYPPVEELNEIWIEYIEQL